MGTLEGENWLPWEQIHGETDYTNSKLLFFFSTDVKQTAEKFETVFHGTLFWRFSFRPPKELNLNNRHMYMYFTV